MSLQFAHNRKEHDNFDATIAIDVVSKKDLELLYTSHADQIAMKIGVTFKSKNEPFVKKKGREAATKNITFAAANFIQLVQDSSRHIFHFNTYLIHNRKKVYLTFQLTTSAESEKVRLIYAWVNKV